MKRFFPFAFVVASVLALTGCGALKTTTPQSSIPSMEKLTPKTGTAFLTLHGEGIQIFRCAADSRGTYWKFEQPQAKLKNKSGEVVAELSGPMSAFDHKDGSRIISSQIIAWVDPANPQKDNKYALMRAVSDQGTKTFEGVKYIQRLDPKGGMPSKEGCTSADVGKLQKVPFSAEYVFWR